jgi:hypothetical protein
LLLGHALVKLNSALALKGVALGFKANMLVFVQALERAKRPKRLVRPFAVFQGFSENASKNAE